MSQISIAINGFGRIGRSLTRVLLREKNVKVVAINEPNISIEYISYLLAHDSIYYERKYVSKIVDGNIAIGDDYIIKIFHEKECYKECWEDVNPDYIIDTTGSIKTLDDAEKHIVKSVKKVILTNTGEQIQQVVVGVNGKEIENGNKILSSSTCITCAIAPLLKDVDEFVGIEKVIATSIHSATNEQNVVDGFLIEDWAAGRSAMGNIIASPTFAAKSISTILPQLSDKVYFTEYRVPTNIVSLLDIMISTNKKTTITKLFQYISQNNRGEILKLVDGPCVSSDFIGNDSTAIVDMDSSYMVDENTFKLTIWYDNEWGYVMAVKRLIFLLQNEM